MDITSAQYNAKNGVNDSVTIVIDGTTMSVPLDPANRHYAAILEAVSEGTLTIQEAN